MEVTKIFEAVILLLIAVVTYFVIPYIKSKVSAEMFGQVKTWVKIAVQAAEMIYTETGMGEKKKEYVMKFLEEKGITLDYDSVNNLIESAVLELKKGIE